MRSGSTTDKTEIISNLGVFELINKCCRYVDIYRETHKSDG